jgi:DNA-binding CsgD family transcriptional regulator
VARFATDGGPRRNAARAPMSADERPLVGRDRELAAIAGALDALDGATAASVLQVAGEPGIGKSRLLREMAADAGDRGYIVLAGRAAEFEAELPFGVFTDALDDWLLAQTADRLAALAGGSAAELAVVLPAFEGVTEAPPPGLQQERYRAHRAVRHLLTALADEAPLVLVLDDVQWADPGSVELLCHLLAHPPRGAVLLALGFRPAQLPVQLGVALAAALREPPAVGLDLAPLSAAAAGDLLGAGVPGPIREQLLRESGGNPFFLLQLARGAALQDRRRAAGGGVDAPVPPGVLAALAGELSSLSAPSLVLLQGAAVTGDPFEGLLAATAADIGAADALDLVDELLHAQLVHATPVAGQYAFRHPIVRATVYEYATTGWRSRAHARLSADLAQRGAPVSAQAPHVERSASKGDADALAVLIAAGRSSAPRAPALAARWYAAALHLLPDVARAEAERIELLVALATALGGAGQLEESRSVLCEVLERLPAGDPGRIAIVAYCAGVEHLLGRHHDANTRLAEAHRDIADSASADAVALAIELGAGAGYENRYADMAGWAEQALAGAGAIGHRALVVAAAGQLALAHYFLGLPSTAIERAAAGLDALDDAELAGRLDIGLWVGWTEAVLERHEQAVAHCQRVIDVSRATGQGAGLLFTMTAQAWSLVRMGRLEDADEVLTAAIDGGRLAPNLFLAVGVGLAGIVATCRGEHDRALRAGREGMRLASTADPGLIPGMSALYLALAQIEAGDAQGAYETLLTVFGPSGELATSRSGDTAAYEVLTRAALALGRPDEAERWAERAVAATHGGALPAEATFAVRATAAVALARGDAPRAAEIALEAATRAAAAGVPIEAGRCRILAARGLVQAGRRDAAIAALEHAAGELSRVGATGYQAEAEKELRRLGRRRRRGGASADSAGLAELTEREREIAELVGQGRTNREIAVATYLSEKTVEHHLSRMFSKLAIANRTALALLIAADGVARD